MGSNSLIFWLFAFTLLAALAIGVWQWRSIKRSRAMRGEHGHVSHPPPDSDTPNNTPP
jgi:hypothetical protein